MQRAANLLASSTLVPPAYRKVIEKLDKYGNVKESRENPNALANAVVALNMAQRMGADPLMVMQNLYIVEARPSWSSQWIIAAINGCGRFSPLRFDIKVLGAKTVDYTETYWENNQRQKRTTGVPITDKVCVAWAIEKESGERIESPPVSIEMAVKEGWYTKNGSKWQTMDEVMLRYRTASFFGKLYAPELLMGLQTAEEAVDMIDVHEDGSLTVTRTLDEVRAERAPAAEVVQPAQAPAQTASPTTQQSAGVSATASETNKPATAAAASAPAASDDSQDGFAFDLNGLITGIREEIEAANTAEELDLARSLIRDVTDEQVKAELNALASQRMRAISATQSEPAGTEPQSRAAPTGQRRPRGPISAE